MSQLRPRLRGIAHRRRRRQAQALRALRAGCTPPELLSAFSELEGRMADRMAELEELYEHAPCAFHSVGVDGSFLAVNATMLRWLGCAREQVLGHSPMEFTTPEGGRLFQEGLGRALAMAPGEELAELEHEMVRRDGTIFWVRTAVTLVRDREGRLLRTRAASLDVTERRRAEQEAREKDAEIREFVNHTGDFVVASDADGRFTYLNPAFLAALGYTADEARDLTLFDIIHPEEHAKVAPFRTQLLRGGQAWVERVFITRSGGLLHADGTVTARVEGGRVTRTYGILHDVTARHEAQDALRQARAHAESAARAKSALLAGISHEMRTPMNAIYGHAQLLQRDARLGPDQRRQVDVITESTEHLIDLVNHVLEVSRVDPRSSVLPPTGAGARSAAPSSAPASEPAESSVRRSSLPLPRELVAELRRALRAADYDAILAALSRLPAEHAGLGRVIRERAEAFDYESIGQLLGEA